MKRYLKRALVFVVQIFMGALLGVFLGFAIAKSEISGGQFVLLLIGGVFFCFLHIVIHEAGHGIFGTISGYKMVSFRILSFLWIWQEGGGILFRRQKVPGTLGQCLMAPPAYSKEKYPFKLYLFGGVLANLITSCLVGLLFLPDNLWAATFAIVGLGIALSNGIPMSFNDGMTIKIASSGEAQRYMLYLQFAVNQQTMAGKTYAELPQEYFESLPESPKHTYFDDFLVFLNVSRAMDQQQWLRFKEQLEILWLRHKDLVVLYQVELKRELLFCLCLFGGRDARIAELMRDKIVRSKLKQPTMANLRTEAVYEYFVSDNQDAALKKLEAGRQAFPKEPNLGDAKAEMKLNQWLTEQIQNGFSGVSETPGVEATEVSMATNVKNNAK